MRMFVLAKMFAGNREMTQAPKAPKIIIYKNNIIYCPKLDCRNYLLSSIMERTGTNGKVRTFYCHLCKYSFSENRFFVKMDNKIGGLRTSLRMKMKVLKQIQSDIEELEFKITHYSNDPKLFKSYQKSNMVITR